MLWLILALIGALATSLTTIFAKIGIKNVNSDFATFFREVQQKIAMRASSSRRGNGSYNRIQFISRHFPEFKSFKSLFHPIF